MTGTAKTAPAGFRSLFGGSLPSGAISVLDQVLLILMIVELLYTVELSFREHVLAPEPFVLVALIAGVGRILVVTPELSKLVAQGRGACLNRRVPDRRRQSLRSNSYMVA
jgi:uncharacterized membrane protein (DUF373 family)